MAGPAASGLDLAAVRAEFPALAQQVGGAPVVFADGPGGTQVPRGVIAAIGRYLEHDLANIGGAFRTSAATDELVAQARQRLADFTNARHPEEIVFGANMTTLTFALSRAIARTWRPAEEIVLTRLDHDANVSPWLLAARDAGVRVRFLDFDPTDCTLRLGELRDLLNERTRLVAVTGASNAVGTITDLRRVVEAARAVRAWVWVDAVHLAPHRALDVQEIGCDFLVSSPYKYFGPHAGVLWGHLEHLEALDAYKVRPAPAEPPGKWETGTQSFETIAGICAAIDYLEGLGAGQDRRLRLVDAYRRIVAHEEELACRFLAGVREIPDVAVYGITALGRSSERTPTFALKKDGFTPRELAERLGGQGICTWDGDYYAVEVMQRLGVLDRGGLLRVGFVHYNTTAEVDRVLEALAACVR